ncbi:hypothetical protein D3C75_1220000 [compost metagenome]
MSVPVCESWIVLPCMICCARTMSPPKAAPMAWWPRHTPRMGFLPAYAWISGTEMPASAGEHGPGDTQIWSGLSAATSSSVIWSLRATRTSTPSSPKYCTRL